MRTLAAALVLASATAATPASAATTVLDFDRNIACRTPAQPTRVCTSAIFSLLNQEYGSTPLVGLFFDSFDTSTPDFARLFSGRGQNSPNYGFIDFGIGVNETDTGRVRFTVLDRFTELTLDSFRVASFISDDPNGQIRIFDLKGNLLLNLDQTIGGGLGSGPTLVQPNISTRSGLVLTFGSPGRNLGIAIDDIVFTTQFVPEPASWAMMIAGFGLVGAAMRRRRAAAV